jgi:hypothetical protein
VAHKRSNYQSPLVARPGLSFCSGRRHYLKATAITNAFLSPCRSILAIASSLPSTSLKTRATPLLHFSFALQPKSQPRLLPRDTSAKEESLLASLAVWIWPRVYFPRRFRRRHFAAAAATNSRPRIRLLQGTKSWIHFEEFNSSRHHDRPRNIPRHEPFTGLVHA